MATAPESIYSKLAAWDILDRLAMIQADAEIENAAIPEGPVRELFAILEKRLPEVSLATDEIPTGGQVAGGIDAVVRAAEAAIDARAAYLAAA